MLMKFGKHKGTSVYSACEKDLPYMIMLFDTIKDNMANINIKIEIAKYIEKGCTENNIVVNGWSEKYLPYIQKYTKRNLKNYNKNNKLGE